MSKRRPPRSICACGRMTVIRCTICNAPTCNTHCIPHQACGFDACKHCRNRTVEELRGLYPKFNAAMGEPTK